MYHSDWFKLRYELFRDYPGRMFDVGSILDAYEFEGRVALDKDNSINPNNFKDHFKLLKWWQHRTIEELLTIKYAKVIEGSNYYVKGDIVEVKEMRYNDNKLVGGKDTIFFSLNGHHFPASQIEPATEKQYHDFKGKS